MTFSRLVPCLAICAALMAQTVGARQLDPAGGPRGDAVAEELARLCLPLGIDFDPLDADRLHPSKKDVELLKRAGLFAWLDSQLLKADDSIAEPPAALREYLGTHTSDLGNVVRLLAKRSPGWRVVKGRRTGVPPELLPLVRLQRILLAAALVAERSAAPIDADGFLEASWSLHRVLASRPDMLSQLLSIAGSRWQAGVLRKMEEPPVQWMERLAGDGPLRRMLDAFEDETRYADSSDLSPSSRPFSALLRRAYAAVADGLRRISPCDLGRLSADEIWQPAVREFEADRQSRGENVAEVFKEVALPNLTSALRRAGRLLVDRELTLKILELRLERKASRREQWPERLSGAESRVCPGASYWYEVRGREMEIRFEGYVSEPHGGLVLPFGFQTTASRPPAPVRTSSRVRP